MMRLRHVMESENSEARYTAAPARSSSSQNLPIGISLIQPSTRGSSAGDSMMSFVRRMPGEIQFTRTPRPAHSAARLLVQFTTPAFDVLKAACFCGCWTMMHDIAPHFITFPHPPHLL